MHLSAIRRTSAALIAAVGLALGATATAAPRASASETVINDWLLGSHCFTSSGDGGGVNDYMCLWYHTELNGAYWGSSGNAVDLDTSGPTFNLSNYSTNPAARTQGLNQRVANNAGSMANGTSNCTVDTYVYGNFTGNYDHLSPGWAGNLSGDLHNNEGSIAYYCS
jgi:hypothetical protein